MGAVLSSMVTGLAEAPSVRLLKHIIRCYLRLSDNPRAREALRQCLPDLLRNPQVGRGGAWARAAGGGVGGPRRGGEREGRQCPRRGQASQPRVLWGG